MISIREAVIVEGKYDKIKLKNIIDAPIIETNGFRIFKDREKQNMIRLAAQSRGLLIMTDSDSAGFLIRNFLKGIVPNDKIKHCYVPQILGREKRKESPSKEGFLGVEGIDEKIIEQALLKSGATLLNSNQSAVKAEITKQDMYALGISGRENSAQLRQSLMKKLGLPTYLTANALLLALNCICTLSELESLIQNEL